MCRWSAAFPGQNGDPVEGPGGTVLLRGAGPEYGRSRVPEGSLDVCVDLLRGRTPSQETLPVLGTLRARGCAGFFLRWVLSHQEGELPWASMQVSGELRV